jgi:hypothetical protein
LEETSRVSPKPGEFLSKLPILICLILSRIEQFRIKSEKIYNIDKRFRIAKVTGYVILSYGSKNQKKQLIWYRYGVYPIHLERTLKLLLKKGIIGEDNNRFFLTTEGLSWLSKRIEPIRDTPMYVSILDEIDCCLFTPMPDLIAKIAKLSPHLNYNEQPIGEKKICKVFDWENFGKGYIEPYHYTLLLSYSYSEKYFEEEYSEAEKLSKKGMNTSPRLVKYDRIPNTIRTDQLKKKRKKFSKKIVPLVSVLDKKNPSYLTQIKIEAKNYIANLWYIVESINIIHILSGLRPTCEEIARVCLNNYLVEVQGYGSATMNIHRMRERMIKNDIIKLLEHGILTRKKWKRAYAYQISAKGFYDIILKEEYVVLDEGLIKGLYEEKIRPYRLDFCDPFGILDKIS